MKISDNPKGLHDLSRKSAHIFHNPNMGADPEFFLADKGGKILNSDRFFPSKHAPIVMRAPGSYTDNKLFFDGIQAEIAVAYSSCRDNLIYNTRACLQQALIIASQKEKDVQIVIKPAVLVDRDIIEAADPEARRFGCAPDINAYTRTQNTPEMDATNHPYRYAGGHIHLGKATGYKNETIEEKVIINEPENHLRLVKLIDLVLSIPTLFMDNDEGSKERRSKYGKAGCFRPTPYGIEYRTPSCWWLKSPITTSLVHGLARMAWYLIISDYNTGVVGDFLTAIDYDEEEVRGIIDEGDLKESFKMWQRIKPYIMSMSQPISNPLHVGSFVTMATLDHNPGRLGNVENWLPCVLKHKKQIVFPAAVLEYMMENGTEVFIENDIEKNWDLNTGPRSRFSSTTGFVRGCRKFYEHKDFLKFQLSFIKNSF